jgi:uncharacterized protein (DUF362 family)
MRCDDYDPEKIRKIVYNGMKELHVRPHGKIILNPNTVIAHPELFPHAFTRKEFIDGVIGAVNQIANVDSIMLGERSGITVPTRYCFKNAGYLPVLKKHGVKPCYFDEVRQVPVDIGRAHTLRHQLFIPEPLTDCFLINLPKFKAHAWTHLTLSLKNFIGIQDDKYRLIDHNLFLEDKIVDLQFAKTSGFIAIDGIIAGQRMMLTPDPFPLGAIIMGVNPCAVDTVCAYMVNLHPYTVRHLLKAHLRGLGPIDINKIEVLGDYPLGEIRKKTKDFQFSVDRIDRYFKDAPKLKCIVGEFPEPQVSSYCWGGCPGALQEAVHIIKTVEPQILSKMKRIIYVVGKVEGEIPCGEDDVVFFVGNCTSWRGKIRGQEVVIDGCYNRDDSCCLKSNDMLKKNVQTLWRCFRNRDKGFVRIPGCPISVADHVHYLSYFGGFQNINFRPDLMVSVNFSYLKMRLMKFLNYFS